MSKWSLSSSISLGKVQRLSDHWISRHGNAPRQACKIEVRVHAEIKHRSLVPNQEPCFLASWIALLAALAIAPRGRWHFFEGG